MRGWGSIDPNLNLEKKLRSIAIHFLGRLHIYRLREKPIFIFATRRDSSTPGFATSILGGTLGKQNLSLGEILRLLAKRLAGRAALFRLRERPIFIFSTRRSGSTLLMQMIHSQPGVDYIDEPLNLWRLHPHFARLPHPPSGKFVTLTAEDEQRLEAYFRDLLSGKLRFRHRGNLLDSGRSFLVRRLVVKDINATPLIDWFYERFDAHVIYLLRHPCAVADSLRRRGWNPIAATYLNDNFYREAYLPSDLVKYALKKIDNGTLLQQYVLEWCLDNLVPLRLYKERPWLCLTYEEMILRSDRVAELLCSRLDLPSPERMLRVMRIPSRTTAEESQRAIIAQGPQSLLTRWLGKWGPDELRQAQEVLDVFGIRAYRADSPFPEPEMCHFGPLQNLTGEQP